MIISLIVGSWEPKNPARRPGHDGGETGSGLHGGRGFFRLNPHQGARVLQQLPDGRCVEVQRVSALSKVGQRVLKDFQQFQQPLFVRHAPRVARAIL